MTHYRADRGIHVHVSPKEETRSCAVLAVGDTTAWLASGQRLPMDGAVVFVDFFQITREFLELTAPRLIVSPLLARSFDCLDLAVLLSRLEFTGQYRVIDHSLPDPHMVVSEVRALAPGLDFGVLSAAAVSA